MGFSINDVNKLTFKVQAGGVIDADSNARWYESKLSFSPNVKSPTRILTDYNLIPPANDIGTAQSNAAAQPTIIGDKSALSAAVQLSRVTTGGDYTWIAYTTVDTPSGGIEQDWIQPPSVPQATGAQSGGYAIRLWSGDPNVGVQGVDYDEIFTTAGESLQPGYVGWVWNYDMGLLFVSDELRTDILANAGGAYPGGFSLFVTGFQYIGPTGGGGGGGGVQGPQGDQGIQGPQGNQGIQGPTGPPTAADENTTTGTVTTDNVLGTYYNMSSAATATTYTISPASSEVGGFARILSNTATQPNVNLATQIKGDGFISNTNMYLTIQFNGNRNEYWLEQIAP